MLIIGEAMHVLSSGSIWEMSVTSSFGNFIVNAKLLKKILKKIKESKKRELIFKKTLFFK